MGWVERLEKKAAKGIKTVSHEVIKGGKTVYGDGRELIFRAENDVNNFLENNLLYIILGVAVVGGLVFVSVMKK